MVIYILTFIMVIILVFTNAITDASNAIATLVGTKVMPFNKATNLSAVFNFIGIVVMSFINISVANCISSMVNLTDSNQGIVVLLSGMISVIVFALIALKFGIPTSETHGLIAGLTGATVAIYGWKAVSFNEWKLVIIGLIWSVLGTMVIGLAIIKIFEKYIKIQDYSISKMQILGCCGMSFMHGAQDGQKFIGILIIFFALVRNSHIPQIINPMDYVWIILYIAVIMGMGVSIGGKKIVENVGSGMVKLDKKQGLMSDISTILTLFIASLFGIPVSTTHAKTVSIISVGKKNSSEMNLKKILEIIRAWIWNFPISGIIGYILAIMINKIY